MPVPVLVVGAGAIRVENSVGAAEIPKSPSGMQAIDYIQSIAIPGMGHNGRRISIATHFTKVNRNPMISQFSPGAQQIYDRLLVEDHLALLILERPGRHRKPVVGRTHPLRLV